MSLNIAPTVADSPTSMGMSLGLIGLLYVNLSRHNTRI